MPSSPTIQQIEFLVKNEAIGIACMNLSYEAVLSKAALKKISVREKEEESRRNEDALNKEIMKEISRDDTGDVIDGGENEALLNGQVESKRIA